METKPQRCERSRSTKHERHIVTTGELFPVVYMSRVPSSEMSIRIGDSLAELNTHGEQLAVLHLGVSYAHCGLGVRTKHRADAAVAVLFTVASSSHLEFTAFSTRASHTFTALIFVA